VERRWCTSDSFCCRLLLFWVQLVKLCWFLELEHFYQLGFRYAAVNNQMKFLCTG
jgi:hypothetical protein